MALRKRSCIGCRRNTAGGTISRSASPYKVDAGVNAPIFNCTIFPKHVPTSILVSRKFSWFWFCTNMANAYVIAWAGANFFVVHLRTGYYSHTYVRRRFCFSCNVYEYRSRGNINIGRIESVEMKLYFMEMDIESEPTLAAFS